ncbi:MAG: hypothetical protein SFW36_18085 [Leptolyngbyaceae cyanobacterium bins.59]|nr:hypothetical protein [Leptolyngbyaceae cyanobacterium bins.59]
MYSEVEAGSLQMTFHFVNGQSESYSFLYGGDGATEQDFRQGVRRFLGQDWWIIKTLNETVCIRASNVLKIEIKPSIETLEGDGVLHNAERVTALNRGR